MAFVQQQRRPRHRSPPLDASTEDEISTHPIPTNDNHILSPDTDWHDISSAIRSSSSDTTSSFSDILPPAPPALAPTATTSTSSILSIDRRDSLSIGTSEPEWSSSFRPSDTESFSDIDFTFGALPSHDGTGAFVEQDEQDRTSEEETTRHDDTHLEQQRQSAAEQRLLVTIHTAASRWSTAKDFEPTSPSMPNILLPYGGIHLPSFAASTSNRMDNLSSALPPIDTPYYSTSTLDHRVPPQFQPTVFPKDVMVSSDEQLSIPLSRQLQQQEDDDSSGATDETSADYPLKFTRKRPRNLDRIPTHHPSFPGSITSFAILSAIWNNIRRLTNHLIENDTYTADAFTTLVSEATLEGCLPFGSHLHMELSAGLRPTYANRRYDGLPGM
ncbi:unnamed protein product [Absidia cylindrospora]